MLDNVLSIYLVEKNGVILVDGKNILEILKQKTIADY
jgi:hypothetical protein